MKQFEFIRLFLIALIIGFEPINLLDFASTSGPEFSAKASFVKLLFPVFISVIWELVLGTRTIRWSSSLLWVLGFASVILISDYFMEDKNGGLLFTWKYFSQFLFLFTVIQVVDTPKKILFVGAVFICTCLISSSMALLQGVTGGSFAVIKGQQLSHVERISGFGGDPNGYAAQIVVGCVWMIQILIAQKKIFWRIIFAAILSMLMLAVILSYSRGGAITLAFALMLYTLLHIKTIGAGRLAGMAIIGVIASFLFIPHTYWERLSSLTDFTTDFSMWRRLSYHLMAPDMFMKSPLIGVGPSNFSWHYMSTDFRFITDVFHGPHRLHDMYLSILVELGILGFFFFIGLIVKTLFNFVQLIRRNVSADWGGTIYPIGPPLLIGTLAYLLSNLFLPGEFSKLLWGLLAIGGSSEVIIRNEKKAFSDSI